jgi:hypothetical protein
MKQRRNRMKTLQKLLMMCTLFVGMMVMIMPQVALAAGTASDTDITNQATVSFDVGGSGQTPVSSNTTTFKVDNKIDLTVAEVSSGYTDVNPNITNQVLTFTVQNDGNTTQDFALSAAANATDPFGGTDNFDASNLLVFVESGANAGYLAGEDTATDIDELASYVNPGDEVTVYIVADIPVGQSSGDIAAYTLTATARAGGGGGSLGAALTETAGADTPGAVDIVFADGAGDTDAPRDASYSDTDAYRVLSAQLTVNKASTVIRDPFNLNTNPKHIPGAYIQYVVTISNAAGAGASATLTTITDTLDNNTAIDPDLIVAATGNPESAAGSGFRVDLVGTTRASQGTPQYFTTTSSVDGVDHNGVSPGGIVTATMATVLPIEAGYTAGGELQPGESVTLTFNVIIQ